MDNKIIKLRQSIEIDVEENKETIFDLTLPDDIKDGEALFIVLTNIPDACNFNLGLYDENENLLGASQRTGTKRDYLVEENIKPNQKYLIGVQGIKGKGKATITAMCLDLLSLK